VVCVGVWRGKIVEKGRYPLTRLALGFRYPGGVLLQAFDWLILPIAIRVICVRRTQVIYEERHPSRLEHLHHQRRARARQTRNDDDHEKLPLLYTGVSRAWRLVASLIAYTATNCGRGRTFGRVTSGVTSSKTTSTGSPTRSCSG